MSVEPIRSIDLAALHASSDRVVQRLLDRTNGAAGSLHDTCRNVYDAPLEMTQHDPHRLNVTLDGEHAAKLAQLAERTHVQEGTLARALLSQALDEAGADARNVAHLLDGIPGAFERAHLGLRQAKAGRTVEPNLL